jgi:thiamine biosynthesis protein ThiS
MNITVNGKNRELTGEPTVATLLEALGLDVARVAVELNRDILPRERFAETALAEGDRVELVQFVGGG